MPDEERDRFIEGFRWCPASKTIRPWEEDRDFGCVSCEVDPEPLGPHGKLVLARYADAAWQDNDRLRLYVGGLRSAEIGEPNEVVAQMLAHYRAAGQSKTLNGQLTNLIKGMAVCAVRAIANARWARAEHEGAVRLRDSLKTALARCLACTDATTCTACEAAQKVLAEVKLDETAPEPGYMPDLDLPIPDPPEREAQEAPSTAGADH